MSIDYTLVQSKLDVSDTYVFFIYSPFQKFVTNFGNPIASVCPCKSTGLIHVSQYHVPNKKGPTTNKKSNHTFPHQTKYRLS